MNKSLETLQKRIEIASGRIPADLLIKNGIIFNVYTKTFQKGLEIAVSDGFIAGVGKGYQGNEVLDAENKYIIPGLIDSHVHIESSMVLPSEFCRVLAANGTTAIIADPHEIVNVCGSEGFNWFLKYSDNPLTDIYWMVPSCVPATHMETSGGIFNCEEMNLYLQHPRILGLGEMMNFPGVIEGDIQCLSKIQLFEKKLKDGHSPFVTGKGLQAYISCGISTDHECSSSEELMERVQAGMHVMLREGSAARNLRDLLKDTPMNYLDRCMFCTDDRHLSEIYAEGHINCLLRIAVEEGISPEQAIVMGTRIPAEHFQLNHLGAIAPGKQCDLIIFESLTEFNPFLVMKKGKKVFQKGESVQEIQKIKIPDGILHSIKRNPLNVSDFNLSGKGNANCIGVNDGQLLTEKLIIPFDSKLPLENDLDYISVINRYEKKQPVITGLVKGFSLKNSALAASVAHDSHNIICIGDNFSLMQKSVNQVIQQQGGICFASDESLAILPLPVGGLLSLLHSEEVIEKLISLKKLLNDHGCSLQDPLLTLSFLSLSVIPHLKITDRGIVDVDKFQFVNLFFNQ